MKPGLDVVRRIALVAVAAGAIALGGCESAEEAADQPAQEQYTAAQQALAQNKLEAAISAADAAGAMSGLSAGMAYKVHMLQGELRVALAQDGIAQATERELDASRVLGELRLSTIHITEIQAQLKRNEDYDPATAEDTLRQKIAQANGGADQQGAEGQLTISGIDGQIASLQSAINDNRQHADSLARQKTDLAEQAEQLQQKSLSDGGQQSVDDVTAAAAARMRAADSGVDIGKLDAAVLNLKADLALKVAQRAGVQKSIDDFNKQIANFDLAWKGVQQDIGTQQAAIAQIAGPAAPAPAAAAGADESLPTPPAAPVTVADQCALLKTQLGDARNLRDQAMGQYKQAIKDFNMAGSAGDELRTSFTQADTSAHTTPGEKNAIEQLEETYSGAAARLAAADAEQAVATSYAAETMLAQRATDALKAAQTVLGAAAPGAIADCLASIASPSIDDLAQLSEDSFKDALDHYDNLMVQTLRGPAAESRKTTAMVAKMISAYGAMQLSMAQQGKPVAGQTPKDLQGMINDLASQVSQADPTRLPEIPYTITASPAAQ